jgi:hypothetical protein
MVELEGHKHPKDETVFEDTAVLMAVDITARLKTDLHRIQAFHSLGIIGKEIHLHVNSCLNPSMAKPRRILR